MSELKNFILAGICFCLCSFCFISCHNESYLPVSLLGIDENKPVNLSWLPDRSNIFGYTLQGGDGHYTATCNRPDIVQVVMVSDIDMQLQPLALGEAVITVSDKSGNMVSIHVYVDYPKTYIIINATYVTVTGNLTDEEKEAVCNEALLTIPVQAGGGYLLIYMEENRGSVMIYPELFGSNEIEGSFEQTSIQTYPDGEEIHSPVFYITINGEMRTFIITINRGAVVFNEDLTGKFKVKYPEVEMIYTSQTVRPFIN